MKSENKARASDPLQASLASLTTSRRSCFSSSEAGLTFSFTTTPSYTCLMSIDVVQAVRDGKGIFQWKEILRKHNGYKLYISVMRDAMKFNDVPAMTWDFKILDPNDLRDGVRLPATAHQLQQIGDLTNSMFMTPVIIEELLLQADIGFNAVTQAAGKIVAITNIHDIHDALEKAIEDAGGDDGEKLIAVVGKYWCILNALFGRGKIGFDWIACNFGWLRDDNGATGHGVTTRVKAWQRPGFKHNKGHWDPSQVIRLMLRIARLIYPDGREEHVDLHWIAKNPELAPLIHHNRGILKIVRQRGVPELAPMGVVTMPEMIITPGS